MNKLVSILLLTILSQATIAFAACEWDVLEDKDHAVSIEDARRLYRSNSFVRKDPKKISFGFSRSRLWIHSDCQPVNANEKLVGIIEYGFLDVIHGYRGAETKPSFVIGDREETEKIDGFAYRLPVFSLNSLDDLYIKVETSGSLQAPITVMAEGDFHKRVKWESLLLGIYYGIFVSLFLYNFCLWAISKIAVYGRYSLFVGLFGLFQLSANGFMNLLDLELFVWLRNDGLSLSILGSQGALLLFASKFLSVGDSNRRLGRIAEATGLSLLVGGLILSIAVDYSHVSSFSAIIALVMPILVLILGIIQVSKRNFVAIVFVVAQVTYLGGVALLGAKNLGLIEPSFFSDYAVQFGSAFEMILLSLGLGLLIKKQNHENHDLTVSKMRSQAVVRTAKMLAHDIRGPLRHFKGTLNAIQNAATDGELRAIQTTLGASSNHALQQLDHMLADFMEFGDELRLNLVEEDLTPLLTSFEENYSIESLHCAVKIKQVLNHSGNIRFDPYRIRRVLTNIVNNAAEATNYDTTITISTRDVSPDFIEVAIHNTGSRIRKRDLAKIFEPFYTEGKVRGTGLGLAIVAHVVKSHRGTISAQSVEGGTTFMFTLPKSKSAPVNSGLAQVAREVSVVILDDCPFVLDNWRNALLGAKTICFETPEKLYQAIRDQQFELQKVDLFIIDRWFSNGSSEDGTMAIEKLRDVFRYKGAIFLSSDDQSATKVDHVISGRIDKNPRSVEQLLAVRA